ncbi:family 16 glycosylhydrolase [Streptomyces sp. NPDC096136]|uniref:family 16 glycosylhydrolase n=1 Tax=Streptomyces sp. NPDC096136 TaxID=3366076 RepID=UPI003829204A
MSSSPDTTSATIKTPGASAWTEDFSTLPDGPFTASPHFAEVQGNAEISGGVLTLTPTPGGSGNPAGGSAMLGALVDSKGKHCQMYGRVDVVMKTATWEPGIVNSFVLYSEDRSEIDFHLVGKNDRSVFTEFCNRGEIEYNSGAYCPTDHAASAGYHTYSISVTEQEIMWQVDGNPIRIEKKSVRGDRFPSGPFRVRIGSWCGHDRASLEWAGGDPDPARGPFITYVKSVRYTPTS